LNERLSRSFVQLLKQSTIFLVLTAADLAFGIPYHYYDARRTKSRTRRINGGEEMETDASATADVGGDRMRDGSIGGNPRAGESERKTFHEGDEARQRGEAGTDAAERASGDSDDAFGTGVAGTEPVGGQAQHAGK
jgi:hypothetical protein